MREVHFGGAHQLLRVATYNIHKGVQGLGPARRLEIHNLALAKPCWPRTGAGWRRCPAAWACTDRPAPRPTTQ